MLIGYPVELLANRFYAGNPVIAAIAPGVAFVAGLLGFSFNLRRRNLSAAFVFVVPVLLFLDSWRELTTTWSPSWSRQSQRDYVMNNLFGPACGNTECLYTIGTAFAVPGLFYSLGALVALVRKSSLPRLWTNSIALHCADVKAAKQWWVGMFDCQETGTSAPGLASDVALRLSGDAKSTVLLRDLAEAEHAGLAPPDHPLIFADSLKKAQEVIRRRGWTAGEIRQSGGTEFFEISDPDGNVIEVRRAP